MKMLITVLFLLSGCGYKDNLYWSKQKPEAPKEESVPYNEEGTPDDKDSTDDKDSADDKDRIG